jgi:hypothetical protein
MGKYDYITELTGADEYPTWQCAVTLALQGNGLWNHCSAGADPNNFAEFASIMPMLEICETYFNASLLRCC